LTNTSTDLVLTLASGDIYFISGTPTALKITAASGALTVNGSFYGFTSVGSGGHTTADVTAGSNLTSLTINDAGTSFELLEFDTTSLPSGANLTVNNSPSLEVEIFNNIDTGTGTQKYNTAITVEEDLALTASTVTFAGALNDSGVGTNLTISGNASFGGIVGGTPLTSLTVTGTTAINTSSITTSGAQNYTGAVTLGTASVSLTSETPSTITFGSTINGAAAGTDSLTIANSSTVSFGGAVGAANPLNALNVNATGALSLNQIVDAGSVDFHSSTGGGAGDISFTGGSSISADSQTYQAGNGSGNSVVDFTGAPASAFANSAANAGPVNFSYIEDGTINDSEPTASQYHTGNPTNLTIHSTSGNVSVNTSANVAGTKLTLTSSSGTVSIGAGLALASLSATGTTIFVPAAGTISTTAAAGQTYTGTVSLSGNTTLDASTGAAAVNIIGGVTSTSTDALTLDSGNTSSNISGVIANGTGVTALTVSGGTVTLKAANTYTGLTTAGSGATLAFSGAGTLSASTSLSVSGSIDASSLATLGVTNVTLSAGTLKAPTSTFNISGNFTNNGGTFNTDGGTVALTGAAQILGGTSGTTFDNLSKTAAAAATLTFAAGITTTVTGTLTLEGASAANLLSLVSSTPGTQWLIDPSNPGTAILDFLSVKDSENTASGASSVLFASNSVDAGDNTNWAFSSTGGGLAYDSTGGNFTLQINGANLQTLNSSNQVVFSQAVAGVTGFTFNGINNAANQLTLIYTSPNALPNNFPITFNGAASLTANQKLIISGGSFSTDTYTFVSAHNGTVQLGATGSLITYTNLTPLTNTGTSADIIFTLPSGTVDAQLATDGLNDGSSVLSSSNSAFETTTFTDPTNSLTVNAGGGTDTITTAAGFSGANNFRAGLTINASAATDTINLDVLALSIGTGALSVTGNTINLDGSTVNTTGTQTYNGPIVVGPATVSLTATGTTSDIIFGGGLTRTGGITLNVSADRNVQFGGSNAEYIGLSNLDVQAGASGTVTGAVSFTSTGITVGIDNQSYRGGNGAGTTSTVDLVTNAPKFEGSGSVNPVTFSYSQDATIADSNIPTAAQFLDNLPTSYFIISDGGTLTVNSTSKVSDSNASTALLLSSSGALTISGAAITYATVRLQSVNSGIAQTAVDTITAVNLGVNAAGNVELGTATNAVSGTFAGKTGGSQFIVFINTPGFTIGSVAASSVFPLVTGLTAGSIGLTSTAGSVTQSGSGIITASSLGVIAATGINLGDSTNVVGTVGVSPGDFAANVDGSGAVTFVNTASTQVATVTIAGSSFPSTAGITAPGAVALSSNGSINLPAGSDINAGGGITLNIGGGGPGTALLVGTITAGGAVQVNGGPGDASTLVGPNATQTWNITGTGAGNIAGSPGISFSNIQNLTGGTGADTFVFSNGKGVTGTITGGGGTNTLNYSAYTTPVSVNLTGGTATGTGGISGIQDAIQAAVSFAISAPTMNPRSLPFTVTVTALDSLGNTVTGGRYQGTIHFTSSDSAANLPANYTFTAADAGVHTFTNAVTLNTTGAQSVSATDTALSSLTGSTAVGCCGPQAGETPDQRFLAQVYCDFLDREPDPTGLAAWENLLNQGVSRTQVATMIEGSLEYRTDEVNALYLQLLHRPSDPTGLNAFTTYLGNGGTAAAVEAIMLGSPEYFQFHGSTNNSFLSAVYQDVLNRGLDPTGALVWGNELTAGTSRTTVATQILASLESDRDIVEGNYNRFLHRVADPNGLSYFVNQLQGGTANEVVIAEIVGSTEYFNRAQ